MRHANSASQPHGGRSRLVPPYPVVLGIAERALRVLTLLNAVYGALLLVGLVASFVAPGSLVGALSGRPADTMTAAIGGMRLMMLVGLSAVPVVHILFARLLAILDTVRDGDPFVAGNARRLDIIALALLALELLHLVVGAIAKGDTFAALGIHIDWNFSYTGWLSVLLLFVLARVFEQGARMRADLEGTV
jgi:hypothetical protein